MCAYTSPIHRVLFVPEIAHQSERPQYFLTKYAILWNSLDDETLSFRTKTYAETHTQCTHANQLTTEEPKSLLFPINCVALQKYVCSSLRLFPATEN